MRAPAGRQPEPIHTFSTQELAQAVAFVQEAQRAQGGRIPEPVAMLELRYGIEPDRAWALARQLEALGYWAVFVADSGACAQVLRG